MISSSELVGEADAGNATAPGGFYRIRRGDKPAQVPLAVHAAKGSLTVNFSDPVEPGECAIKVWSLKRSEQYGSDHYNEHPLAIRSIQSSTDRREVVLKIPDLAPTQCYELKIGGRVLHGTIHQLR